MARWEPDARGRLVQAAMELYRERGFDQTTVAEIAARAGLTERTFFRYFADKREVLFFGASALRERLVDAIADAPRAAAPLETVVAALEATAPLFEERRSFARQRHALITAHAELQEREVMKMTSLAAAASEALRGRGVPELAASLAAEAGITIFKVAFERWVDDPRQRDLSHHIRSALRELGAAIAGTGPGLSTSSLKGRGRRKAARARDGGFRS